MLAALAATPPRCSSNRHFHHVDPAQKAFAVSLRGVTRSLAAARAEAAKCVLLCSNCHAEVEHGSAQLPNGYYYGGAVAERPSDRG